MTARAGWSIGVSAGASSEDFVAVVVANFVAMALLLLFASCLDTYKVALKRTLDRWIDKWPGGEINE